MNRLLLYPVSYYIYFDFTMSAPGAHSMPLMALRKILFVLLIVSNAGAYGSPLSEPAHTAEDNLSLFEAIDDTMHEANISGLALMITSANAPVLLKAFGHPDQQKTTALTLQHYFRIGSVSKMFTGLALMKWQKQLNTSLETPVANIIDAAPYDNRWQAEYPLLVAHLMEHTAGITDMSVKEFSHNTPLSLPEAFKIHPESRRLKWPPGLYHSYSNSGSGIAAYIIEKSSGRPFESFVEAEVFIPLGLTSATYLPTAEVKASLVTGYDKDGITPIPYWHTLYRAFAGINIRSIEMIRVVRMYLNQGKIDGKQVFSPAMINRMETPHTTLSAKSGLEYGYGLGLYHFNYKGFPFIGHGGDADGYLSFLAYSRNLDLGYFVSFNAYNNAAMRDIRHLIQDHLIRGKTKPAKPKPWTLSDDRRRQIQGTYQAITHRFGQGPSKQPLEVFVDDNELFTRHRGRKRKLIPVNALHFRRIGEPVATIAIISKSGSTYFQGDIGNYIKR